MDHHAWACIVLPLNGFGSTNLILICFQFLLFANKVRLGAVADIVVVYTCIEKNYMDGPECYSAIAAFFLLSFRNKMKKKTQSY